MAGELPLWLYTLLEAQVENRGLKLGPVAGKIVAETLVGLVKNDPEGFFQIIPDWHPGKEQPAGLQFTNHPDGAFTMVDLLKFVGAYDLEEAL